jgi:hypothetical protein
MEQNITSATIATGKQYVFIQAIWTGTPYGTLRVEVSGLGGTWNTLDGSSIDCGGAAGSHSFDILTSAPRLRLVYTFVSGTGTLSAMFTVKG